MPSTWKPFLVLKTPPLQNPGFFYFPFIPVTTVTFLGRFLNSGVIVTKFFDDFFLTWLHVCIDTIWKISVHLLFILVCKRWLSFGNDSNEISLLSLPKTRYCRYIYIITLASVWEVARPQNYCPGWFYFLAHLHPDIFTVFPEKRSLKRVFLENFTKIWFYSTNAEK